MKRLLLALILAATATAAYAACTSNTILTPDGRMLICSTCCTDSGSCTTVCL